MTASCSGLVKDLLLIWLPSSLKLTPHKSVNGLTGSTHHKHLHESVLDPDPAAVPCQEKPRAAAPRELVSILANDSLLRVQLVVKVRRI